MSAVDDVISSQPIVTDPNQAWGGEPLTTKPIVEAFLDASQPADAASRDPFGDHTLSTNFDTDIANNRAAGIDPFE